MLELSYAYSMDAFVNWQFGTRIGSNLLQDEKERKMYLSGFFGVVPYFFWAYDAPWVASMLSKLGWDVVPKSVTAGWKALEDWNLKFCDKAYGLVRGGGRGKVEALEEGERPTVWAQAFEAMTKAKGTGSLENGQPYPQRLEIASDMFAHNSAAHETSGNTMAYLFYELSQRPALQVKLREELLTLTPPLRIPPPGTDTDTDTGVSLPDPKAVDALPLLDALLLETLRLYPTVPGRQPRVTPRRCSLGGYRDIPAGTTVQCYAGALQQTPEVFPNPAEWRPDRWLEASEEELVRMKKWFWAFGSGGRMCIGRHFAMFCKSLACLV
jgi:hypothetical protein